ncbi:MAG TPA: hypothetical protein VFX88_05810 [Actinomycetota bacterium]|nr:hypothetical protein [Actinomycetota bacterium]
MPKRPPTVYSPEQTGSFLAVAAGDRLAAMWVLLVASGMRPSEVLGLPWAAVDLDAGIAQGRSQREIRRCRKHPLAHQLDRLPEHTATN